MISYMRLKHWKSHEETELRFEKGTNLLVGPIGAGKSSVVDAICFALFGTFPALKSRRVVLDEVVMQRPRNYSSAEVEMRFSYGGKNYSLLRTISEGKTEAFLREDDKLLEGPQSQRVTEMVVKILGIDYELFARAIYAEQNKIEYFVTLGKGERKKQMDELLGIDRFESARMNASTVINRFRALKNELNNFVQGIDFASVEAEEQALVQELNGLKQEDRNLLSELRELVGETKNALEQLRREEEKEKTWRECEREKAQLEGARENLKKKLSEKKALVKKIVSKELISEEKGRAERNYLALKEKEKTLTEIRARMNSVLKSISAARQKLSESRDLEEFDFKEEERILAEMQTELERGREDLKECRELLEEASRKRNLLESSARELEKQVAEEKKLGKERKEITGGDLAAKLEENVLFLSETQEKLNAASARALGLENALSLLRAETASCPVCGSALKKEKRVSLVREKEEAFEKESGVRQDVLQKLNSLNAEKSLLQEQFNKLEVIEEKLKSLAGAGAKLSEENARLAQAVASENKLRQETHELEEKVGKLFDSISEKGRLVNRLAETAVVREGLEKNESELASLEKTLLQEGSGFSEEILAEAERALKEIELQQEILSAEAELAAINSLYVETEKSMMRIAFNQQDLVNARNRVVALEKDSAIKQETASNLRRNILEKEERRKDLGKKIGLVKEKQKEIGVVEEKTQKMVVFQSALVETQAELRNELVESINEAMLNIWPKTYPYNDYRGVRLSATEDDYAFELLAAAGNWVSIEEASGGEKSCASLALRIALASVLAPSLSWLILDEPTHNLDSQAVKLLSDVLREEIPSIVEQTFIITHDEALKESASARIYRIDRDKDKGERSIAEEVGYGE
jgi:exonuclease SbcC